MRQQPYADCEYCKHEDEHEFSYCKNCKECSNFVEVDYNMESKFKVGDKVRVLSHYKDPRDIAWNYPTGFSRGMLTTFGGKVVTISEVAPIGSIDKKAQYYNGDAFIYRLAEDFANLRWHSSMFESTIVAENEFSRRLKYFYPKDNDFAVRTPRGILSLKLRHSGGKYWFDSVNTTNAEIYSYFGIQRSHFLAALIEYEIFESPAIIQGEFPECESLGQLWKVCEIIERLADNLNAGATVSEHKLAFESEKPEPSFKVIIKKSKTVKLNFNL